MCDVILRMLFTSKTILGILGQNFTHYVGSHSITPTFDTDLRMAGHAPPEMW